MSILDKRVCDDDINRVNEIRNHPKYERGFEQECRVEKVWHIKGENGLPVGYFMFEDIQEQFDKWQQEKKLKVGGASSNGGKVNVVNRGASSNVGEANVGEANVGEARKKKRETIWDKIEHILLKYIGME